METSSVAGYTLTCVGIDSNICGGIKNGTKEAWNPLGYNITNFQCQFNQSTKQTSLATVLFHIILKVNKKGNTLTKITGPDISNLVIYCINLDSHNIHWVPCSDWNALPICENQVSKNKKIDFETKNAINVFVFC